MKTILYQRKIHIKNHVYILLCWNYGQNNTTTEKKTSSHQRVSRGSYHVRTHHKNTHPTTENRTERKKNKMFKYITHTTPLQHLTKTQYVCLFRKFSNDLRQQIYIPIRSWHSNTINPKKAHAEGSHTDIKYRNILIRKLASSFRERSTQNIHIWILMITTPIRIPIQRFTLFYYILSRLGYYSNNNNNVGVFYETRFESFFSSSSFSFTLCRSCNIFVFDWIVLYY